MALALFDVFEDSSDYGGVGDFAEHTKLCATIRTSFEVDTERPIESGHPRQRRGGGIARVLTLLGAGAALAGHDEATVTSVGGEQAVISHEMGPRSRLPEAARRAMKSSGSNRTWVVPSENARLSS